MDPVVHFEMPAENKQRMSQFYTQVFGWKTEQLGPEMGNYVLVETTETENDGFPKERGHINGGFADKNENFQCPHVIIAVQDIQESMKKVKAGGGQIIGGQKPGVPDPIPGVGLYIAFIDTEGNRVGLLQPERPSAG